MKSRVVLKFGGKAMLVSVFAAMMNGLSGVC